MLKSYLIKLNLYISTVFILLTLTGCFNLEHPNKIVKEHLVFKSKKIKYSDITYIYYYDDYVKLNIYSLSGEKFHFSIYDDEACQRFCEKISKFYKNEFGVIYRSDTLYNVLNAKPIYGSLFLKKVRDGFVQKIATKRYNIVYKVSLKEVVFKDIQNKIIIIMRGIK